MSKFCRVLCLLRPGILLAVTSIPAVLTAADAKTPQPAPQKEVVDVFSGMQNGRIEVRLIMKDESRCRLMIANKTDKPLSVMLPEAFAGVPVLAQRNLFDPPNNRNNRLRGVGRPQAVGIGAQRNPFMNPRGNRGLMNVPNAGGRQNQFQGLLFNIPAEKVGKFKFRSVCLDHGRPEPRPHMTYEIKPLADYTQEPGVGEVCAMLGRGEIGQRAAQLAAWHLNNGVSWEELAGKRKPAALGSTPVYSPAELQAGRQAAEMAVKIAKAKETPADDQGDSLKGE